jgi:hypothetical protein
MRELGATLIALGIAGCGKLLGAAGDTFFWRRKMADENGEAFHDNLLRMVAAQLHFSNAMTASP